MLQDFVFCHQNCVIILEAFLSLRHLQLLMPVLKRIKFLFSTLQKNTTTLVRIQ